MKKTRSRFYLLLLFDWIMFSFLIENEGRRGVIVMETEGGLERDGEGGDRDRRRWRAASTRKV